MKASASQSILDEFARLRLLVGFLGQRNQRGWWDCAFLDPTGIQFLGTTFPRTARLAGLRSTTEAACRIQDQALGRGTFHLFRLPLALEDRLEEMTAGVVENADFGLFASAESALADLASIADSHILAPSGPVQIGVEKKILTRTAVTELAAHYASAFSQGIRCFPYFASDPA